MALIHINFFSQALGMCAAADVILPQNAAAAHPTLYLLHGMGDNHTIWGRRTSIERYVSALGLAVVMPGAHLSSYANMAHGYRYFDYVAHELPRVMRGFFPLSPKREHNFIAGLSMGGAGAMKIGLARPECFAAIGCLSSGMPMPSGPSAAPATAAHERRQVLLFGGRELSQSEEDCLYQARKIVREGLPAPRIFHSCGSEDFALGRARATRDFFQSIPGNPFGYTYEEHPGGHTWEYWDEHIQNFLSFTGLGEETP